MPHDREARAPETRLRYNAMGFSLVRIASVGIALVIGMAATACAGGGEPAGTPASSESQGAAGSTPAAQAGDVRVDVPDACTFIAKADLESLVGRELRDGERRDAPSGESQCGFATPPELYVTRRFDNPALPGASGFSAMTVTTNATSAAQFEASRKLMASDAPPVPDVGDAAFFATPAMVYVRVGTRAFSIRVHVNAPTTENGKTRLREVMLGLARAGAAKL
jgi:hypothetical protein